MHRKETLSLRWLLDVWKFDLAGNVFCFGTVTCEIVLVFLNSIF